MNILLFGSLDEHDRCGARTSLAEGTFEAAGWAMVIHRKSELRIVQRGIVDARCEGVIYLLVGAGISSTALEIPVQIRRTSRL